MTKKSATAVYFRQRDSALRDFLAQQTEQLRVSDSTLIRAAMHVAMRHQQELIQEILK